MAWCNRSNDNVIEPIAMVIKEVLKPDGNIAQANAYADAVGMDDANKKILHVFKTEGQAAAVKAMFTGDNGEELDYCEMRRRYG